MTDIFARVIKKPEWIAYAEQTILPEAFMLREYKDKREEKGVSVICVSKLPQVNDIWLIAKQYIGNPKKPVLGYGELSLIDITSCEIKLYVEASPSEKIPHHYEIKPILELMDKCRMATQLAAKARLIFAP